MTADPAPGTRTRGRWRHLQLLTVTPPLRWVSLTHSVLPGEPWRRICENCGAGLALIGPSAARFGGAALPWARCGSCRYRVGPPPWTVEAAALLALALGVVAVPPAVLPAYAWWAVFATPLLFVDLAVHRLPDRLTYPAAAGVYVLLGVTAAVSGHPAAWLRSVAAGAGAALLFAASTIALGRRGFGLGDAKLALSCAALLGWFGWGAVVVGLMAAFVISGLTSLALLAARRVRWTSHIPFGPFLILGTAFALLLR